jgi:hypothetical protein
LVRLVSPIEKQIELDPNEKSFSQRTLSSSAYLSLRLEPYALRLWYRDVSGLTSAELEDEVERKPMIAVDPQGVNMRDADFAAKDASLARGRLVAGDIPFDPRNIVAPPHVPPAKRIWTTDTTDAPKWSSSEVPACLGRHRRPWRRCSSSQ